MGADVVVNFDANTSDFSTNVKKGGKALNDFEKDTNKAKDSLDSLKKGLGEESKFGNLLKILSGAGAVAGLSLAGRELNKFADKYSELQQKIRDGATGGEVAEELAKSLPIFGEIITAGRKFRAELDGTADAARKLDGEVKSVDATGEYLHKRFERMKDMTAGLGGQLRKIRDEMDLIGKSAADQERVRAAAAKRDELEAAKKSLDADKKGMTDESKGSRDALNSEVQKKLEAVRKAKSAFDEISISRALTGSYSKLGTDLDKAEEELKAANARSSNFDKLQKADLLQKEKQYRQAVALINQKYAADAIQKAAEQNKELVEKQRQMQAEILGVQQQSFTARVSAATAFQNEMTSIAGEKRDLTLRGENKDGQADLEANRREANRREKELVDNANQKLAAMEANRRQMLSKGPLDAKDQELLRQQIGEREDIVAQANAQILAVRDLAHQKELNLLKRQEQDKWRVAYEAENARRDLRIQNQRAMDDINAEMRDKQLRHDGQAEQADREKIQRDLWTKQAEILGNLNPFDLSSFSNAQKLLAATKARADQDLKFLDENVQPQPLATATQRRFDFTIPGVDRPEVDLAKQQLKVQVDAKKIAEESQKHLAKLAGKNVAVVGIK